MERLSSAAETRTPRPVVGEALAYVQGESLKAGAVFQQKASQLPDQDGRRRESMQEAEPACAATDDEISLLDILRWAARWWWLVLGGCVVGCILGLIWHLASDERFTVRLDMTVAETPLGTASFVREVSTNFLSRHVGTAVAVEFDQRRNRLSLVEREVRAEEVALRTASMHGAAAALGDFLDGMVSREYARMQDRLATMESSADAYTILSRFRIHVSALQEGLLKSVAVSESVERHGFGLAALLGLGVLFGAGLGGVAAFTADTLGRGRSRGGE